MPTPDTAPATDSAALRQQLGEELCIAVKAGDAAAVEQLLAAGASPQVMYEKNAALHWAVLRNHEALIPALVCGGAHVEQKNEDQWNALHLACRTGNLCAVEELLVLGASPHARGGTDGRTAKDMVLAEQPNTRSFHPLLKAYEQLPPLNLNQLPPRDQLGQKNRFGKSLLDHPALWERLDSVNNVLEQRGETPLGRDVVMQKASQGEPQLLYALRLREHTQAQPILAGAMRGMAQRAERLHLDELLTADAEPTPLLAAIDTQGAAPALFCKEQWQGQPRGALQQVFGALSENAQAQVKNLHALTAELRNAERHATSEQQEGARCR